MFFLVRKDKIIYYDLEMIKIYGDFLLFLFYLFESVNFIIRENKWVKVGFIMYFFFLVIV